MQGWEGLPPGPGVNGRVQGKAIQWYMGQWMTFSRRIMATGLAGGLTKPYKGMEPAAPTRPGLPAHAPIPLDAAQSSPFPLCPQFFL